VLSLPKSILNKIHILVDENPDAIVSLIDSDGLYRYISPSTTAILGYSQQDRENALGTYYTGYTHPDDITHAALRFEDAILNDKSVVTTRRIRRKNGDYLRMRGTTRKLVDPQSGEVYLLQIGRPAEVQET